MYLLFNLTENLPILFKVDAMSIIFAAVTIIIFLGSGIFSLEYMSTSRRKRDFMFFICWRFWYLWDCVLQVI